MRHALILAGGSGTRLWPLSRDVRPKQLIPVLEGRSLMEEAWGRLEGVVPASRRLVCGAERHRAAAAALIPALAGDRYIGEPEGRDTLAALALSSALIAKEDPEAVVGVFTSDHVIRPREAFRALLERAYSFVESRPELLLTFGVRPEGPATAFGYLELGEALAEPGPRGERAGESPGGAWAGGAARRVVRFREKPDAATAESFVAAGPERYLWNSGMFVWKAARFLELVGRYESGLGDAIGGIVAAAGTPGYGAALAAAYPLLKKTSVDFGVMERASRDPQAGIAALPLELEWRDIGSWNAYAGLLEADASGNAASGEAVFADCSGSVAVSLEPGHLVACLGCEDLVVVHTADATLVCPRSRAEELKKLHALVAERRGGRWR